MVECVSEQAVNDRWDLGALNGAYPLWSLAEVKTLYFNVGFTPESAGLNFLLLTPLWTRTAHVVPLRMVCCRFPKLGYG
jgi:hypothetical protein